MKVSDPISKVLQLKGSEIFSVAPQASVYSALEQMAEKRIGALLVMDKRALLGIISERDYARKVILKGHASKDTPVSAIMTPSPVTVRSNDSVEEAMRIMSDHHIRHLPVVDSEGQLAGMVSIGDVVKWIITAQEAALAHMQHYIMGDLTH